MELNQSLYISLPEQNFSTTNYINGKSVFKGKNQVVMLTTNNNIIITKQ